MGRVNRNFFVFVWVCVWGFGGGGWCVTIHRNSRMVVSKKGKVFRLRAISIIFFFNEKKEEEKAVRARGVLRRGRESNLQNRERSNFFYFVIYR